MTAKNTSSTTSDSSRRPEIEIDMDHTLTLTDKTYNTR